MTKEEDDRAREFEERDVERVQSFIQLRTEVADKLFSQAINGLFLSNAGAALATLSFVGVTWKDGSFPRILLCPLALFILGLILMGAGTTVALWRERGAIARNQYANSLLDIYSRDIWSPVARVGLAPGDWRMILAALSGGCFVAGCFAGLLLLALRSI
jgi:hypothetical protein